MRGGGHGVRAQVKRGREGLSVAAGHITVLTLCAIHAPSIAADCIAVVALCAICYVSITADCVAVST